MQLRPQLALETGGQAFHVCKSEELCAPCWPIECAYVQMRSWYVVVVWEVHHDVVMVTGACDCVSYDAQWWSTRVDATNLLVSSK